MVWIAKKESNGDDLDVTLGHFRTPSLVGPYKRISPVHKSFTRNEEGKNSIDILLERQNCEMEFRFLFMLGTQRTLRKVKVCECVERVVEPVWEMKRPVLSPITMSSEPSHGF